MNFTGITIGSLGRGVAEILSAGEAVEPIRVQKPKYPNADNRGSLMASVRAVNKSIILARREHPELVPDGMPLLNRLTAIRVRQEQVMRRIAEAAPAQR